MPWVTKKDTTYWMPVVVPEKTEEWQQSQEVKIYFTHEQGERSHPKWTYASNGAYVDDEYLFYNEGWKLIIDDGGIEITRDDLKKKLRNSPEDWEEIDKKTLKVTYSLIDFTTEEIEFYKQEKWYRLRKIRGSLLNETDWIIVRASEENLTVSQEVITYRQNLRNFPDIISDILEFDLDNLTLWPTKPETYFEE